ncbi:MAG: hypothetical protein EOO07_03900, partial [Chitinophagaceae bacterium]
MKRIALLFFGVVTLMASSAFVLKVDPFADLLKKLAEFTKQYPAEKIHLHLDKPYYLLGEDIWFKAYVIDSRTAEPTNISNVLYVELINDKDSVEKQVKLSMLGGIAWGDFKLTSVAEGKYRLRAYTQWMRNAGPQFFFDKAIVVGQLNEKVPAATVLKTEKAPDVQFFPEGGTLVEALPSKVAIKVLNANGIGENISGKIIDNEGTEILAFETTYLGMGSFSLTPLPGKIYTALVKFKNGNTKTIPLPKSLTNGYVLNVNTLDTAKIGVKVFISEALCNGESLNLLAHQNGHPVFTAKVPTAKQIANLSIPTEDFLSGIITLTLFSAENIPLAERIVFVNNGIDKIDLQAKKLKPTYAKRENINLDILAEQLDKPTQGSFSVSVTNATLVKPDLANETHILSSLLLTADLIGNIENPNHYFTKNDISTKVHLDHLLLTQGWRKIDWKAVDSSLPTEITKPVQVYPAEKGLRISGVVKLNGKPVATEKVSLLSTAGGLFAIDTLTDANGKFSFDKLQFGDEATFTIQCKNPTNKKPYDIILDYIPQQAVKGAVSVGEIDSVATEASKSYIVQSKEYAKTLNTSVFNKNNSLKEVEIKGEKLNKAPNSSNRNGAGVADAIFTEEDLKSATDLKTFLYGRTAGLSIVNNSLYLTRSGINLPPPLRAGTPSPMQVFIDGIEGSLESVSVPDIESVEVLKSIGNSFVYGTNMGVLVITTKRGGGGGVTNKLKEVEILAKANKAPNSSNFNGPGSADAVFDTKDLKSATSLTQFLNGRVSGFTVTNGIPRLTKNGDTMTVYVDGVVFIDGQGGLENPNGGPSLEGLEIGDIESIEILKSIAYTAVYG